MTSETPPNNSKDQEKNRNQDLPLVKIGEILKESRKKQNMSTAFLAASLRMGEEQLIALEEGNEAVLPEKVFIKAMIQRVSERLKINSSELIQEFDGNSNNLKDDSEEINQIEKIKSYIFRLKGIKRMSILLFLGITSIAIVGILLGKEFKEQKDTINSISSEELINDLNLSYEKGKNKEVIITSLKPSKATIVNSLGEVLFDGVINKPLTYSLTKGLEIYAYRPDLIEIGSKGMINTVLGSEKDIKWHDIALLVIE